jgi:enamine deaminase RidA (YjgF/YER057c/UK114 family)
VFLLINNFLFLIPKTKSNLETEFGSCLSQAEAILKQSGVDYDSVLQQTLFINARNNADFSAKRNMLRFTVHQSPAGMHIPISVIAQPPASGHQCAMELVFVHEPRGAFRLERKCVAGALCTTVTQSNAKEMFVSGITCDYALYDAASCAHNTFESMKRILTAEGFTFSNIIRQWNYIEGITDFSSGDNTALQNYHVFNNVRSLHYSNTLFENGYPASTGIGTSAGGITIDFIALKGDSEVDIRSIDNPRQVSAYRYTHHVLGGQAEARLRRNESPKFERGKFVRMNGSCQIFVSGTSAIRGQNSVSPDDAEGQTAAAIENIMDLLSECNLSNHGIETNDHIFTLSHMRAYIKHRRDAVRVKRICEKYLPGVACLFLISDICRKDLLVELEGMAECHSRGTHSPRRQLFNSRRLKYEQH